MAKKVEDEDDEENNNKTEKYPTSIFCIIATEFCERFSFCGLRTILSLYLRNELMVKENAATIVYHVFIMLCYLVPLVGAILADSILGRYRTILYFSLVYLFGDILTCLAAIPPLGLPPLSCTILGLILIATGTGGIKPCVAAFGGDQFNLPSQEHRLQTFFSTFYFTINFGGFVGMVLTPVLRKSVTCYGEETCYAMGFGFPAALMLLALILFVSGKPWYRMKKPKGDVLSKFFKCTISAIKMRRKSEIKDKEHWLDYSEEVCDKNLIRDMKLMYSIIFLYIPLPLFWSLFDQQGSRWTFQASRTNGTIPYTHIQVLPDQMQVVNPAIVLMLIPVFERGVYPYCAKLRAPLSRMTWGGLAAGAAFLASGLLELQLQRTYPHLPGRHRAAINVINTLPCDIIVNGLGGSREVLSNELVTFRNITIRRQREYNYFVKAPLRCGERELKNTEYYGKITIQEKQVYTVLIGITDLEDLYVYITEPVDYAKSLSGKPRLRIAYMHGANDIRNVTVTLTALYGDLIDVFFVSDEPQDLFSLSQYVDLAPGRYSFEVGSTFDFIRSNGTINLELGGVYTLVLREFRGAIDFQKLYTMTEPNTVHMVWLIPQYFLISIGEIMFAISGLEFSFTQAPKSMKTITIASWYLSVALGNFLVIIITQAKFFTSQAHEFFLFSALIAFDMMIFAKMCSKYQPVNLQPDGSSAGVSKISESDDLSDYISESMPLLDKAR